MFVFYICSSIVDIFLSFLWVKRLTSSSFSYCLVLEFAHKSGYGVIMHFNISCFNIIFRKLLLQHLAFYIHNIVARKSGLVT